MKQAEVTARTHGQEGLIDSLHQSVQARSEALWNQRIYQRWGMTSVGNMDPQDIVIAGYPKSGNTWFQNLVAGIVYGLDARYSTDSLVQHLVPDIDVYDYYRRYGTPTFFKSHQFPQPRFRRVVYLLRDGRDVMVSYYHYLVAHYGDNLSFEQLVRDGDDKGHKWHEHVEAWLANPYCADMLIIRYEDLRTHGPWELSRLCEFIDRHETEESLAAVYEQASFQNMRQRETWDHWDHRPWWPKDRHFVRRGQVGSYKDEMPPEILQAFLAQAGDTLRRCGYDVDESG